jgi:serine/threonine protein kinase
LKLSDEDIKSAQETLSEGQKRKVVHDTHKTRVDIASSLVKLGCSITKEDKNKLSPWGVVTKPKNEELQNVLLESEHIEEVTLESNRSLYVDFETSLNSRDAAAEKGKDEDEGSAEVYVGFLQGEAKMLAVKFLQFKNEKKFMDEVNNMKSVRSSNHVLNYWDSVIVKPKGRSKTKEGYIVMEKANYTVSDVIKRRKGAGSGDEETEEAFRINILEQTVDALVYIHKKDGILHRDLKPDNIFVVEDERLVVKNILI